MDERLFAEVTRKRGLSLDGSVTMLPFAGRVGAETRRLYFSLAQVAGGDRFNVAPVLRPMGPLPVTRIISFGECNVACPYCKRDCQFRDNEGNVISQVDVPLRQVFEMAEAAHARGETVRFSGGDPVVFPRECLAVSEYLWLRYGARTSIAHNGTGPAWVRKMAPYLSSAAIDLKAPRDSLGRIMGISQARGQAFYNLSLQTQGVLSDAEIIMDVRTPVFGDTTLGDMVSLGEVVARNNPQTTFWTWRLYKPVVGCEWQQPEKDATFKMLDEVSARFPALWMGVRAKWAQGGMMYWRGGRRYDPMPLEHDEARGSGNV